MSAWTPLMWANLLVVLLLFFLGAAAVWGHPDQQQLAFMRELATGAFAWLSRSAFERPASKAREPSA